MSRGYSKIHSRKYNAASQSSIQFDKLLNENSNRPTASKSSGTLGKWGVISCTSIRSTNLKGRREEAQSTKRKRADYGNNRNLKPTVPAVSAEDPFSFDIEPGAGTQTKQIPCALPSPSKPVIKPKKFFKSRNAESAPIDDISLNKSTLAVNNRSTGATYGGKKYSKDSQSSDSPAASKKFFTSKKPLVETSWEQTEAINLSSSTKTPGPSKVDHKPPIVLRIFKGTSHLVVEPEKKTNTITQNSTKLTSSNSDNPNVRSTRSTRSTKNYSEIDDDSLLNSSFESSVIESPKKSKKTKVLVPPSSSYEDIVHLATDINISQPVNKENSKFWELDTTKKETKKDLKKGESKIENITDELKDSDVDEETSEVVPEETNIEDINCSQDIPLISQDPGLGSSLSSSFTTLPSSQNDVDLADNSQTAEIVEPLASTEIGDSSKKEDEEKLQKANELLTSTYIDFNSAAEKLLQPHLKLDTQAKTEWFSDSEDSNSTNEPAIALSTNDLNISKADSAPKLDPELSNVDIPVERTCSPATKKGSIFKSRSLLSGSTGTKKRLALYKHKWSDNDKPGNGSSTSAQPQPPSVYSELDEEFESTKLTRVTSWPMSDKDALDLDEAEAITSVKCTKKAKGFYTVVRNVKRAHQIQESGEFQEFNDDVEYILDALQDTFSTGTRCLSAITLASKCMAPAFRMHVRAHGTVAKFFRALHDATKDQSLGLCTATVMFVLSQDRLNMDLDRHSLELMLNLLESDVSHRNALDACGLTDKQLHKNKQKVRELCAEIQSQGHAKHLNLDNITVGHLAMETLLSLTSRRAGEWFKEELRELGGLEHIVKTICECCRQVDDYVVEWTDPLLDKLRKVDRCLRVLENVTYQNEENQLYLLRYSNGILLDTLVKLFRQCDSEMPLYPVTDPMDKESTGTVIREVLLATLKVLINLTHDFNNKSYGSALAGERKGIIDSSLHLLLQVPDYVPDEKKFDMLVLALILLINLIENCPPNRKLLFEAKAPPEPENVFHTNDKTAVQALIALFHQQDEQAKKEEMKTDAILEGKKDTEQPELVPEKPKSQEEFIEETVAKLLQKAGRNMEHTLIGAYVGLLLGFLIMENMEFEVYVRQCFPEKTFETMVATLQKVYNFMILTASAEGSKRGIAQTEKVINFLSKSDKVAAAQIANIAKTEEDSFS